MKVYAVLVEDRHCDAEVPAIFPYYKEAEDAAIALAKDYCRHDEDYEEHHYAQKGLLFSAVYSCENDRVSVIETELSD